jgi:predicted MPP superfamily phosphohydrolase
LNIKKAEASKVLIHEFKIERNDIKKKVIYHFSDVHLTEYDEFSDENERNKATELKEAWERVRKDFALYHGESYEDFQVIGAKEHLENLIAHSKDGTALVMTGDIIDFIGGANIRAVDSVLSGFDKPFISVCGNHEDAESIPEGFIFSKTKDLTQIIDLGDLLIFGIDNSKRFITKEQNEKLKELISRKKPIIIAMHVPVMTEGNKEKLLKCDEYFRLNHSDATAETLEFIDILKQNSEQIVAVFAGHLHFGNESEIAPKLTQYVASQGILGNLNRYIIGV